MTTNVGEDIGKKKPSYTACGKKNSVVSQLGYNTDSHGNITRKLPK
jgi:hypothetical protein